jgi:hypothetical protein
MLHPLLGALFRYETRRRLAALSRFLAKSRVSSAETHVGNFPAGE